MSHGKLFVKPSCLIQKKQYEKQRQQTIERNALRLDAMGLKTMAHSLFGSNEKANTRSTMNRKSNIVCHRDEEYQPFEGEKGDNISSSKDDESSWSHVKKFRHMAYRKKQGGYSAQLLKDSQSTSKLVNTPLPRQLSARQAHNRGERMPIVAEQPTQPPTSTTEQDNHHPNLDVVSSRTGVHSMFS